MSARTARLLPGSRRAQPRRGGRRAEAPPVPWMLNVFVYGWGDGTATAGVRAYLFSPHAADYVRREEPAWRTWLQELVVPARPRKGPIPCGSDSVEESGSGSRR